MKKFRVLGGFLLVAVALIVIAGVVYASIPNNGVITACYLKSGGTLRVIDPTVTNCKTNETSLEWNLTGPAGPPGQDGTNGTNGQDGVSGYEIVTNDRDLSSFTSAFGSITVDCPAGKNALGGGGTFITAEGIRGYTSVAVIGTTAPKDDGSGWIISYQVTAPLPGNLWGVRVFATCATVQ